MPHQVSFRCTEPSPGSPCLRALALPRGQPPPPRVPHYLLLSGLRARAGPACFLCPNASLFSSGWCQPQGVQTMAPQPAGRAAGHRRSEGTAAPPCRSCRSSHPPCRTLLDPRHRTVLSVHPPAPAPPPLTAHAGLSAHRPLGPVLRAGEILVPTENLVCCPQSVSPALFQGTRTEVTPGTRRSCESCPVGHRDLPAGEDDPAGLLRGTSSGELGCDGCTPALVPLGPFPGCSISKAPTQLPRATGSPAPPWPQPHLQ